jgi:ankyrin repeat protein
MRCLGSWGLTYTPLHSASTVRLLLEVGAELHLRNHTGVTPLFQAVLAGHASAVTALVAGSAKMDRRLEETDHFVRTPVQLAELRTTPTRREQLRSALAGRHRADLTP